GRSCSWRDGGAGYRRRHSWAGAGRHLFRLRTGSRAPRWGDESNRRALCFVAQCVGRKSGQKSRLPAMKRRTTSDEERKLFEQVFKEGRPIKPVMPKPAGKKKTKSSSPSGINGATQDRLRKGLVEPDAHIDLHGMTQAAAHRTLISW